MAFERLAKSKKPVPSQTRVKIWKDQTVFFQRPLSRDHEVEMHGSAPFIEEGNDPVLTFGETGKSGSLTTEAPQPPPSFQV